MIAGRQPTVIEQPAFWARFGRVEHEALEFKSSANNLREVIPAMAMTRGGQILLGVSDDRRLIGCRLDQQVLDSIMRRAQEARVEVRVDPLVVGGVPLTLVTVPRVADRIVTTADGRLLRRVGSDNTPLAHEQLGRFVRRHLGLRPRPLARFAARALSGLTRRRRRGLDEPWRTTRTSTGRDSWAPTGATTSRLARGPSAT